MQYKYLPVQQIKRSWVSFFVLIVLLIPFSSFAQPVGATISNPIVMGTYSTGTFSYTDTKNNSTSYGYINNYGQSSDDIYYKFTIQGTTQIDISHCGSGINDSYLHLLNSDGSLNVSNDDNGPLCTGLKASIRTTLAAGTYYIVSEGYSTYSGSITTLANMVVQAPPAPVVYDTRNFIRTWDATAPEQDANALINKTLRDVKQNTVYFDGLGRPEQTVVKKGSLMTATGAIADIVSPVVYDEFGRQSQKYLPYASPTSDGLYKSDPLSEQVSFYNGSTSPVVGQGETFFYSKTNFEASPLNRPNDSYAPGNSWAGSEANPDPAQRRNVQMKYYINTAIDAVRIWNVTNNTTLGNFGTYASTLTYSAGELYKTVSIDEHKKQVIEFKDKEGKVILKKVQISTIAGTEDDGTGRDHPGWLCTYYIYDDLNNLRAVIQPEGVKALSLNGWVIDYSPSGLGAEQTFRYEYDQRNRMIVKKVPGAGEVYMVYDARDRLVLTQDANMRVGTVKWMYTKYDDLNRPLATGLWPSTLTWAQHTPLANPVITYPGSALSGHEELTRTFYDSYTWPDDISADANPFGTLRSTLDDANFNAPTTTYPYYQALTQSNALKGMVTGSRTKVLGTASTYLYSISFYDDKGRPIQTQIQNITTGTDISTTQYNWAGQPMISVMRQQKGGAINPQTHVVITKMFYDDLGRVLNVKKTINSTINAVAVTKAEQLIVQNEYDALGQLKKKTLGANNLENLTYDYNIRGWMLGMNRAYSKDAPGSNYFGFDLGYEKASNSIINNQTYTNPQYNGNIEGMVWKSKGDGEKRKYDFVYDAANRLMKADFTQYTGTLFNQSAGVNYDVKMGDGITVSSAYDDNGNIKQMQQWGLKINTSTQIDNLKYTYTAGTNKLKSVTDFLNDATTKLGDFKTNTTHPQNTGKAALLPTSTQAQFDAIVDYAYDANGNLITDLNKSIGSSIPPFGSGGAITYNHLNLPWVITVLNKGTITYTYDAAGNKIKKQSVENPTAANGNKTITTTTTYIAGNVYESKTIAPADAALPDYTDRLQFIAHEEGRIRFKPPATLPASFEYDYMLKDHLGNVRMVLTEEQQSDMYPAATMEVAQTTTEELLYANLNTTRIDKPVSYPVDNTTNPNAKVAKVSAAAGMQKVGPSITLKVMADDKFNLKVSSWYKTNSVQPGTPVSPLPDLLAALINGVSGASGGKVATTQLQTSGVLTPGATNFLNSQTPAAGRPKAYLNWILFDEQFNFVSSNSGFEQVPAESAFGTVPNQIVYQHVKSNLSIDKCGYLYVYVSNETPNIDVFFDNLQVTHTRGALLETTNYYPGGLVQSGISYKAAGKIENKKSKFNGYELNTDFDLNMYESFYRMHDPQLGGRFWQIDPKPNFEISPYAAMGNNPISLNDFLGDTSIYYNNKGVQIGAINRGKGVTAVEVGNNWAGFVGLAVNAINGNKDLSDKQVAAFDILLQGTGTAYNITSMSNFYSSEAVKNTATTMNGTPISSMENLKFNGKSVKPNSVKAETSADLVMKNGKVTVGNLRHPNAELSRTYPPNDMGTQEGYTGAHIHTHANSPNGAYTWKRGFEYSTLNIYPNDGPSGGDQTRTSGDMNYNRVRNVVADRNYIYLINGTDKQTIKIPR